MNLTSVFLNSIGVLVAGLLGNLCKKGIPEKLKNSIMMGLGLYVLYIGVSEVPIKDNMQELPSE